MQIVVDTSVLIAVLVSEPERVALIRATQGVDLLAPGSVHWEVGNAMSAMVKRERMTLAQVQQALAAYSGIAIRFVDVDLALALEIAGAHQLYAYDAYLITCALVHRSPLLTLDHGLKRAATAAGITLVEVEVES